MNYEIITAPLIGATIGVITNGIAIKMLFRPWKALYIGKFHVPFTPGLIPKEKPRIAKAIAKVIGTNLLDDNTIRETLLSDDMKSKIMSAIDSKMNILMEDQRTLSDILETKELLDMADEKEHSICHTSASKITDKIIKSNVSATMIDFASEELIKNANPMIAGIASKAINSARDSIIAKIDSLIREKAPDIIEEMIDKEYIKIKGKTVSECVKIITEKFPEYRSYIWNFYVSIIQKQLSGFLKGFNIAGIVEQKINDFELPELERIIMEIARKELNSLVALGGLLGLLMGFLNILL